MYVRDMRHTEPWNIKSPRDVCGGSGIVALVDFVISMPVPIVYAVGGWWIKPPHMGMPNTRAGYQLNVVLIVKNQELTEYVGDLVNYDIICLSGMCVGDMGRFEPWYIESPRDVCWGSGTVALDDFVMFVPFSIMHAVGMWWTKMRHIGIPGTCAEDQLNNVFIG